MWNKRLKIILLAVGALLLIPLVGMQFTDAINWTLIDFIVAAALLAGTGIACEFVLRKFSNTRSRIILCTIILILLILCWVELAVGLFGTPLAGS